MNRFSRTLGLVLYFGSQVILDVIEARARVRRLQTPENHNEVRI